MEIPRQGEPGEVLLTFPAAMKRAAAHAVAAEQLDKTIRDAHADTSNSDKWHEAKQAAERFPREVGLANMWSGIAQAMK